MIDAKPRACYCARTDNGQTQEETMSKQKRAILQDAGDWAVSGLAAIIATSFGLTLIPRLFDKKPGWGSTPIAATVGAALMWYASVHLPEGWGLFQFTLVLACITLIVGVYASILGDAVIDELLGSGPHPHVRSLT